MTTQTKPKKASYKTIFKFNFKRLRIMVQVRKLPKLIALIAVGSLALIAVSCSTSHNVIQSSTSERYIKGDTTVTTTTIKYEQVGNIKK